MHLLSSLQRTLSRPSLRRLSAVRLPAAPSGEALSYLFFAALFGCTFLV